MRAVSLLVFLALAGSATAAMLGNRDAPGAEASAINAAGSFSFGNSRVGLPIFSAAQIGPGDSVAGTVEIADTGSLPGVLTLTRQGLSDVPGMGGGTLSSELTLRVTDVTAPADPTAVYSGPLASMPAQPAGRIEPGASRTYEFVAALPDDGSVQNDLQGASTSVAYSWTATEAPPAPEPTPAPSSPPPSPGPSPDYVSPPATRTLRLAIGRVRHTIRGGRLVVWASCDSACTIAGRGRLHVRGPAGHRSAQLRVSTHGRYASGIQRLRIRMPQRLRGWLESSPGQLRLRVRLALRARSPGGAQATARRVLRVRATSRGSGLTAGSGLAP